MNEINNENRKHHAKDKACVVQSVTVLVEPGRCYYLRMYKKRIGELDARTFVTNLYCFFFLIYEVE
jgi:hypothetical protein